MSTAQVGHSPSVLLVHSTCSTLWIACSLVGLYVVVTMLEGSLHPFDVLECEPEVVSGYYVDHGSVGFMVIYLGEGIALLHTPHVPYSP